MNHPRCNCTFGKKTLTASSPSTRLKNKTYIVALLLLSALTFIGCNSTKQKINDNCSSGVVLILNQYYYSLTLPNGGIIYLAGDGEGNITNMEIDSDSINNCVKSVTGTGFFISKDGKIATNKHVASRTVSDKSAIRATKQVFNSLIRYLESQNDTCEKIKNYLILQYNLSTDNNEKEMIAQAYHNLEEGIKENEDLIREIKNVDPGDATIKYNSSLKVAYNATFVRTTDDLYPCLLRDTSDKDIAIIQLNSKQTPPEMHIFDVPSKNMLEHYSFGEYISKLLGSDKNEQLYMIGFNRGFDMANTADGIYSQCTEGTISQMRNDIIQYSINTEPGSSGSPVLNRRGQLVAINFAGYRGTQNFNYGVKEKYLYELMNKE